MTLTYPVGAAGSPLPFEPTASGKFKLVKKASQPGCPTAANISASFAVTTEGTPAPEPVLVES